MEGFLNLRVRGKTRLPEVTSIYGAACMRGTVIENEDYPISAPTTNHFLFDIRPNVELTL